MKSNKLISVIVPIYKAEKCLNRCVDSILAQSYKDFEVLLINDGSPDNCSKICDDYSAQDNRVKVLHKENQGVSAARNDGIRMARGEYIMFVDSDDEIYPDAMKVMIEQMVNECDVVIGKTMCFSELHPKGIQNEDLKKQLYDLHGFIKETVQTESSIFLVIWSKLFKTDIINKNRLRFDVLMDYGEDTKFMCQYLILCKNIYITSDFVYKYYQATEGSLSSKKRNDFIKPAIMASKVLKILYNKENGGIEAQNYADKRKFMTMLQAIDKTFYHGLCIKEKIRAIKTITDMDDVRKTAKTINLNNKNAQFVAKLIEKKANIRLFIIYSYIYNIKRKRKI